MEIDIHLLLPTKKRKKKDCNTVIMDCSKFYRNIWESLNPFFWIFRIFFIKSVFLSLFLSEVYTSYFYFIFQPLFIHRVWYSHLIHSPIFNFSLAFSPSLLFSIYLLNKYFWLSSSSSTTTHLYFSKLPSPNFPSFVIFLSLPPLPVFNCMQNEMLNLHTLDI